MFVNKSEVGVRWNLNQFRTHAVMVPAGYRRCAYESRAGFRCVKVYHAGGSNNRRFCRQHGGSGYGG